MQRKRILDAAKCKACCFVSHNILGHGSFKKGVTLHRPGSGASLLIACTCFQVHVSWARFIASVFRLGLLMPFLPTINSGKNAAEAVIESRNHTGRTRN